jgi:uncharacterized alpha-E superfamily protein
LFCTDISRQILDRLPQQSGRLARRHAAELLAKLQFGNLQEVYANGLETYLETFVKDTIALADAVHTDYLENLA